MALKTESTRVNLKYDAGTVPCEVLMCTTLIPALEELGYVMRGLRSVAGGAQFEFDDLTLTVTQVGNLPGDIRVLAYGPDDGSAGSAQARSRFRTCADAARALAKMFPPKRIEWRHRGGVYITQAGKIAVVSGMRGTTGQGARRKAAARAFSLYGTTGPRSAPRPAAPPVFRIGGNHVERPLPEKLAQWSLNAIVCVISLPFGAALVTYGLLAGGSLAHSARWIALTALSLAFVDLELMLQISGIF